MCWFLRNAVLASGDTFGHAIDFRIMTFLANHADTMCRLTWPSITTIARRCRCSVNTARTSVERLEKQGTIRILRFSNRSHMFLVFPDNSKIHKSGPITLDSVTTHLGKNWHGSPKDIQNVIAWLVDEGKICPEDAAERLLRGKKKTVGPSRSAVDQTVERPDEQDSKNCAPPLQKLKDPPPNTAHDSNNEPKLDNPSVENHLISGSSGSAITLAEACDPELEQVLASLEASLQSK